MLHNRFAGRPREGDIGMDLGIAGRRAIVCASSRGLGKGSARALAEDGVKLTLNGRDAARLEATAAELRSATGAEITTVAGDISSKAVQDALFAACPEPDILINNNGGPPPAEFRALDRAAIEAGIAQNMLTPIALIQRVLDGMVARRFGRIVNITSSSVLSPIAGLDVSSGARAGLTAFLGGIVREVAASNVTINFVLPGVFDTDRIRDASARMAARAGKTTEEMVAARVATLPAGRMGTADEFGRVVAFLASAHAGYITGQNILVDGGMVRATF